MTQILTKPRLPLIKVVTMATTALWLIDFSFRFWSLLLTFIPVIPLSFHLSTGGSVTIALYVSHHIDAVSQIVSLGAVVSTQLLLIFRCTMWFCA